VITVDVTPSWMTIRGMVDPALTDLIHGAPEPPYAHVSLGKKVDYLRSTTANLLYLDEELGRSVDWRDPDNRLFEAKAYRFLSNLRLEGPGDYERDFPFKLPCDPWQIPVFTHGRKLREIALAPCALGTGKSKMALDIAAAKFLENEIDGVLIVAPNGVHRQWINEAIPTHMSPAVPVRCHIWKPTTKIPKDWPLNPRESLRRLRVMAFNVEAFSTDSGRAMKAARAIMQTGRFMLIMDESSRIKNGTAQRTRVLCMVATLAKVRMILTGTPVTKGLENFYSQFRFLNPDIIGMSSWSAFRNRYCVTVPAYRGAALGALKIVGYKNQEELFRKMAPVTFMIGPEVLGLGEPIRERREVTLTTEQEEAYHAMSHRLYEDLMSKRISTPQNTLVELLRLQQILCGWVYETAVDEEGLERAVGRRIPSNRLLALRQTLEDNDGQALVWARFTPDIDDICAMMEHRQWKHVRFDGTVKNTAERERRKLMFHHGEVDYFNGNPAAGGTGVDGLQERCSLGVYYSNSFNREHRWQSEGRIYRRGQKAVGRVRYLDLIVPRTVDELFLKAYETTEDIAKMVLSNPTLIRGGL